MAYATGLRVLSLICALLTFTIVLAPITVPLWYFTLKKAKKKEKAREMEINLMREYADGGG